MVGGCECQLGIANAQSAPLHIQHRRWATEVVHDVTIDVQQKEIVAKISDDMIVPYLSEHGFASHSDPVRVQLAHPLNS
jgi:hypothetical protein